MMRTAEILINREDGISDDDFITSATEQFVKQLSADTNVWGMDGALSTPHLAYHIHEAAKKITNRG